MSCQEEWQLGIVQSDTANAAVNGTDDFEGAQVDNLGWIAALYPEAAHLVTLEGGGIESVEDLEGARIAVGDRKSTRLNSSHVAISYAVFCLKKKKYKTTTRSPSNTTDDHA